jgi:phage terminase small subunit
MSKPGELRPKQRRFVLEYLKDLNGTQAYLRAGYNSKNPDVDCQKLLGNSRIKAEIQKAVEAQEKRLLFSADDVLREYLKLAFCDIGRAYDENGHLLPIKDIPEDVRRAISSVDTEELWEGYGSEKERIGNIRKVKFWEKTKALEALGRTLKLFTDKAEISGPDGGPIKLAIDLGEDE